MKTLITLTISLALSTLSFSSFAQLEVETLVNKGEEKEKTLSLEPSIAYLGKKEISKKFDFTYFAQVSQNWAQASLGFAYKPKEWISVGLRAGIEQRPKLFRATGSLFLKKNEKNSFLAVFERGIGKDNYFYFSELEHELSEHWKLSLVAWRYHGVGPKLSYKIPKTITRVGVLPAYNYEMKSEAADGLRKYALVMLVDFEL